MYIPKHFHITDTQKIVPFIRRYSFATIIAVSGGMPEATHIPMVVKEIDGQLILEGHLAKANDINPMLEEAGNALLIFRGPHSYVSSKWYKNESVPTWNFTSVHVYGRVEKLDDDELMQSLSELIDVNELQYEEPLRLEHISDRMVNGLFKHIVGYRLVAEDIQAKFKLSQNKSTQDRENVIRELAKSDSTEAREVADFMKRFY